MAEIFFEVADSKYNDGIFLEEYNGTWSLIAGQVGRDGNKYKRWVFPQGKDRQPAEKPMPLKINLGDRISASSILKSLYWALNPKEG